MANYLNEFIETIQGVPDEVQRNFCLIRERDQCFTTQQRDLLKLQADYLADLRKCVLMHVICNVFTLTWFVLQNCIANSDKRFFYSGGVKTKMDLVVTRST